MSAVSKVLLVSDQQATTPVWILRLAPQNLKVILETSLTNVMQSWAENGPDLMVFDTSPPESATLEAIRALREEAILPVLMLTSNRNEQFLLEAYAAGVDECIAKPIGPALLNAKIRAWLRRSWSVPANLLEAISVGDAKLVPSERTLLINGGRRIPLTNLEMRLLYYLMSRPGRTATVDELCERVWGYGGKGDVTTLKNVVYRLRRKIEPDPAAPSHIQTVPGVGYRFGTR